MDFINLTERTGVPRTTNSVTANDPGAFCVASAGKLAGVDATLKRLPLCPYASACPLPATVAPEKTLLYVTHLLYICVILGSLKI